IPICKKKKKKKKNFFLLAVYSKMTKAYKFLLQKKKCDQNSLKLHGVKGKKKRMDYSLLIQFGEKKDNENIMFARLVLFFLSCLLWILNGSKTAQSFQFYSGLQNSRVQSSTYFLSTVIKNVVSVEVINKGNKVADHYLIAIPKSIHHKLARLQVQKKKKKHDSPPFVQTRHLKKKRGHNFDVFLLKKKNISGEDAKSIDTDVNDMVFYSVQLPKSLPGDNGQTVVHLELALAWVHLLEPLPEKIAKTGKQFVVLTTNRNFLSPYQTNKLNCKYVFPTDKFKSFPKLNYCYCYSYYCHYYYYYLLLLLLLLLLLSYSFIYSIIIILFITSPFFSYSKI
ncbi:hypothetical protein RFI_24919, partial [Reticulomyxa filosa]